METKEFKKLEPIHPKIKEEILPDITDGHVWCIATILKAFKVLEEDFPDKYFSAEEFFNLINKGCFRPYKPNIDWMKDMLIKLYDKNMLSKGEGNTYKNIKWIKPSHLILYDNPLSL